MPRNGRNRKNAAELIRYTVPAAAATAASAAGALAATALANGATTPVTAGITQPSAPRALSIVGNAVGINGTVTIAGTNAYGEAITENIVANGTTTVNGAKAFASITSITLPARNNVGDTISVGFTEILGLPSKLPHNTVVYAFRNNVREGTAPTVTTSTSAVDGNTFDLNSALNGTVVDIWYMVV